MEDSFLSEDLCDNVCAPVVSGVLSNLDARLFQSPLYICVTNYTRPVVRIGFASLNREIESQLDVMDEVTVRR